MISANDYQLIEALLRNGIGIGELPGILVDARPPGQLVRVLPDWDLFAVELWVLYPSHRMLPRRGVPFPAYPANRAGRYRYWRFPS